MRGSLYGGNLLLTWTKHCLIHAGRLQMTHHDTGGGCRNRSYQVSSWSSEEAGLDHWT
jgi:hypothetical protein